MGVNEKDEHPTSNGKNKEHLKVACEEPFGCEFRVDRLSRVYSGIQTSALRGHASQRSWIGKRIRGRMVILWKIGIVADREGGLVQRN